ncbi:hypothetical protein DRQ33_01260 [bacterium]|nr:MAG: hypothetical protein DRQ33_01260 [bacterium]
MKLYFLWAVSILPIILTVGIVNGEPYQSDEFMLDNWAIPSGMGGNQTVISRDGLSASGNPALCTEISGTNVAISGGNHWTGLVSTMQIGMTRTMDYWGYGVSADFIGGDGIKITQLQNSEEPLSADNYPSVIDEQGHYTVALNIAAARQWRNISVGVSAKGVRKKIPQHSGWGFAFSAGALWNVLNSVKIGAYAQNISTYRLFWDDDIHEIGLPAFSLGVSWKFKLASKWAVQLAPEVNYGIEEGIGFLRAGMALSYDDILTFALGTQDGSLTTGAKIELNKFQLGASAGYNFSLGESYNISVGYNFPSQKLE